MNSPKIEVRAARASDAKDVARLASQLGYEVPLPRVRKLLGRNTVFVADLDGFVAGLAEVRRDEPSLIAEPSRAELVALVVDEGFRSGGVGAALVAAAEAWARSKKLTKLRLRCNLKREAAHRFYERLGYENTKTSKVFDKDL